MVSFFTQCRTLGIREALLGGTGLRHAGRLEGFCLRFLFAWVVWRSFEYHPGYSGVPWPVGIANWGSLWDGLGWDLTRLADPAFWARWLTWIRIALVLYVLGIGLPVALPFLTAIHIAVRTLGNSQGAAHHGFQMVGLALLTQTLVVWLLAAVRLWRWGRKQPPPAWAAPGNWTWLWLYTIAIAAATYVTSVCTKLEASKGQWLENSPYVATQIVKTYRQNYYNNLDPRFVEGSTPSGNHPPNPVNDRYRHPIPPAADWLGRHQSLARVIFGAGFFLELLAFLAVIDRRFALLIGLGLVSLHGSVAWLMELSFPFNERMVGVFFVNAAGWIILMLQNPAWRPSRLLWSGCLLAAVLLTGLHLATSASDSPAAHFLALTVQPALVVPELFVLPAPVKWTLVLATQTLLLAALALSLRSLDPRKLLR